MTFHWFTLVQYGTHLTQVPQHNWYVHSHQNQGQLGMMAGVVACMHQACCILAAYLQPDSSTVAVPGIVQPKLGSK